jgi:adenine-specific DNA methylase
MVKKLKSVVAYPHTPPYKIHKYFARRPWNVFRNIIQTYTKKGDKILDPFMGGGVTVYEGASLERKVIGYDLNPLSKFIVENMLQSKISINEIDNIYLKINKFINDLKFKLENSSEILWSELTFKIECNYCKKETLISNEQKINDGRYRCQNQKCVANNSKIKNVQPKNCKRIDRIYLYAIIKDKKGEIKKLNYSHRNLHKLDLYIKKLKKKIKKNKIIIPNDIIPLNWDRQFEDQLIKKKINSFQDLFTKKNLLFNLLLLDFIKNLKTDKKIKKIMRLVFSSSLRDTNIMSFTNRDWQGGKPTTWAKHAYWIPSQFCEVDIQSSFKKAYERFRSCLSFNKETGFKANLVSKYNKIKKNSDVLLVNSSIQDSPLSKESVDAIITDPPYGSNVQYLELSHFWHVWNKDVYDYKSPNFSKEAISNRKKNFEGAKNMTDYEENLYKVFASSYLALKTSKHMTLTFNNKDIGAWLALLLSIFRCGFSLDKNNIIFQDGVENYQQTAHTKYDGAPYGDFICTFIKLQKQKKELPITLAELISDIDLIFMKKIRGIDKNKINKLKISMFSDSIDSINKYAKNKFDHSERAQLYSYFGKNYLKKIYG